MNFIECAFIPFCTALTINICRINPLLIYFGNLNYLGAQVKVTKDLGPRFAYSLPWRDRFRSGFSEFNLWSTNLGKYAARHKPWPQCWLAVKILVGSRKRCLESHNSKSSNRTIFPVSSIILGPIQPTSWSIRILLLRMFWKIHGLVGSSLKWTAKRLILDGLRRWTVLLSRSGRSKFRGANFSFSFFDFETF